MKYISLVLLALQNAVLILVMRHATTREGKAFLKQSAVVMAELLKCVACLTIIFFQESFNVPRFIQNLKENIVDQPMDCVKISVPGVIYMLQNNLLYVAVANLEAATYQVSTNMV